MTDASPISTAVAARQPQHGAPSLRDKMSFAVTLAAASLLPAAYRDKPGNVLLAMELGDSLGLPTITAINNVHVIEGKPSASSALIGALVRKAGHRLRISGDARTATAEIVRHDDPDYTYTATWDIPRAQRAGLANKTVWKAYPEAMLKARALTECARAACMEALLGMSYTPEELGAEVGYDEEPVTINDTPPADPAPPQQQAVAAAPQVHDAEVVPDEPPTAPAQPDVPNKQPLPTTAPAAQPAATPPPAQPVDDGVARTGKVQAARIVALFRALGQHTNDAACMALCAAVLQHPVSEVAQLRTEEAEELIDNFTSVANMANKADVVARMIVDGTAVQNGADPVDADVVPDDDGDAALDAAYQAEVATRT